MDFSPFKDNELDPKFIKWIQSINNDWSKRITYEPFEEYKKQAALWHQDSLFDEADSRDTKESIMAREKARVDANSLYFFDRYVPIKEGDASDGTGTIEPFLDRSFEAQKLLFYVDDTGISSMVGKARQIGSSTARMGVFLNRILNRKSFFAKFVCKDASTTEEIFSDKCKFPFYSLPDWMRPSVSNDSEQKLVLAKKLEKGNVSGMKSRIEVVAPTRTAINGGSPNMVGIDEIGEISILQGIMDEGHTTQYMYNHDTGKQELKRQVCMWGTAGRIKSHAFEEIFKPLIKSFNQGDLTGGMLPIYLDYQARQGMDSKSYEQHKIFFMQRLGSDAKEDSLISFRQQYPRPGNLDDMFCKNFETILSYNKILEGIDRIRNNVKKCQWGRFEPIWDDPTTKRRLLGATFIPASDDELFSAPICIYEHPEGGWKNRYYQGTDPIKGISGHSKMASAIFDSHKNSIPAVMNWRNVDYLKAYEQAMCLGLYYDFNIKNLIENNDGSEYINKCYDYGIYHTLVGMLELPSYLRVRQNEAQMGIKKADANAEFIMNRLSEFVAAYSDNINIEEFFSQLKTFVKKPTKTGNYKWERDSSYDFDDLIHGVVYAYISRICFPHQIPVGGDEKRPIQTISVLRRGKDMRLYRETVIKEKPKCRHDYELMESGTKKCKNCNLEVINLTL